MSEGRAGQSLIAFPAEVVARRHTFAVTDARAAVVGGVGSMVIRSVTPLVEHLLQ